MSAHTACQTRRDGFRPIKQKCPPPTPASAVTAAVSSQCPDSAATSRGVRMTQQRPNKVAIRALMSAAALSAVRSGFPIRASGPNHVNTRTAALFSPPLLLARRVPKVSPVGAVDVRRIRVLRRCRRPSPRPWPLCGGRLRRRDWCGSGRRGRGCPALLLEPTMPRNLRQACSKRAAGAHPSLSRRTKRRRLAQQRAA